MTSSLRVAAVLWLSAALGACSVPVYLGGHTDDYAETIRGMAMMDPMSGTGPANMTADRLGITCSGMVSPIPGSGAGIGSRAQAKLTCSDGRILDAEMLQTSLTGGTGSGHDDFGNSARFIWDMSQSLVDSELARAKAEVAKRGLGIDHLLVRQAPNAPRPQAAMPAAQAPAPASSPVAGLRFPTEPVTVHFRQVPERPDDVAVIIGNADYARLSRDIPDVRPAYADAEGAKRYATRALGIREGNVIFMKDATGAQMIRVFGSDKDYRGQLHDWVKPGKSRVFVYYSGHGAPALQGGTPFLVPSDADPARLELNGYPVKTLYDNLARLGAESVTVVLEACFSGVSQAGSVLGKASPVYIQPKAPPAPAGLSVITAGQAEQVASWEQDESHGLFTKYFLLGQGGEADKKPHGNGDGQVSTAELGRYLDDTLTYYARRYYGRDQKAMIVEGKGR